MVKTYIIAEAGVNHDGSLDKAKELVDAAVEAGADAVKFQTYKTERLVTAGAERADYQKRNVGGKENQYEMLKRLELSFEDFTGIKKHCDRKGIQFLSTPFDEESAEFLVNDLGMGVIKIPSGEVTNLPFLSFLASFNRPLILSTGMSDMEEIDVAIKAIKSNGFAGQFTLLHCTTEYPCPSEHVNLRAMTALKERFGLPVGYSDHTMGVEASIAAVALGAVVIEKHFTLDREMKGPDHKCSLEPHELKTMIMSIRNTEKMLGSGIKVPTTLEIETRKLVRKTIVLKRSLNAGSVLSGQDLTAKRAEGEIAPSEMEKLVGHILKRDKKKDEAIYWHDVLETL